MNDNTKGILLTIASFACCGLAAPLAKYIYTFPVTPNFMLSMRYGIASLLLWGYLLTVGKHHRLKLNKRQLLITFLFGGVLCFLGTTCYFNAINFIPISLLVLLFYTYPFMVNIFVMLVFKQKLGIQQLLALVVAFIGLVLTVSFGAIEISIIGVVLALLAAASNATCMLLFDDKSLHYADPLVLTGYANGFCFLSYSIACTATGQINFAVPTGGWLAMIILAVSTVFGISLLARAIQLIGAAKSSIVGTVEPLEAIILSFIFFNESMTIRQIIGMVLILSSVVIINAAKEKKTALAEQTDGFSVQ